MGVFAQSVPPDRPQAVKALQRKGCSPEKHFPPDLEVLFLFPTLLKTYGENYGHPPLPVSQKEWFARLERSNCAVDYCWYRCGVPVLVPHVVFAGLLASQVIVHLGPMQPLSRLFDGYFQISLPKKIIFILFCYLWMNPVVLIFKFRLSVRLKLHGNVIVSYELIPLHKRCVLTVWE